MQHTRTNNLLFHICERFDTNSENMRNSFTRCSKVLSHSNRKIAPFFQHKVSLEEFLHGQIMKPDMKIFIFLLIMEELSCNISNVCHTNTNRLLHVDPLDKGCRGKTIISES